MKTLTLREAQRFLIAAAKDKYGFVFRVALWTGMRPEEYLGLQWKDVDFDEGTITILRAMLFNRKGGGWYFKEPKTAQSRRTIPIPAHLVGQLKRHRTKQLKERLKAGDKYQNYDLVFATSSGSPILIRNLDRRHFKPLLSTKAVILIILSFVAALIARYPFPVAAPRSPSPFRSNPQPAVFQSVQVHA